MTPVEIAALLNAIAVLGRLALEAVSEMKTGGLTDEEITRAWAQMQARLDRADALWRQGPKPAPEPAVPTAALRQNGQTTAVPE